jgi:hypothetical protein
MPAWVGLLLAFDAAKFRLPVPRLKNHQAQIF